MSSSRPRTPSASLVISILALIVAMGGTAYAGISLHKNSVGSKQLKKNSVTAAKIANGAVTSAKIKNGAVTAAKLNTTGLTVPNAQHATNANTATSASNASHAVSANTAGGLTGVHFVASAPIDNPAGTQTPGEVQCPAGQYAVGGGVVGSSFGTDQAINSSVAEKSNASAPTDNAWGVDMINTGTDDLSFTVYATCVSGSASIPSTATRTRGHK